MDRLLAKAKTARVRARGMLLDGVAHEQIVRAAKRQKAGLIVMGTHGRTGRRPLLPRQRGGARGGDGALPGAHRAGR